MKKVSQNGGKNQDRERACKLDKQTGGERRQGRHMLVRGILHIILHKECKPDTPKLHARPGDSLRKKDRRGRYHNHSDARGEKASQLDYSGEPLKRELERGL